MSMTLGEVIVKVLKQGTDKFGFKNKTWRSNDKFILTNNGQIHIHGRPTCTLQHTLHSDLINNQWFIVQLKPTYFITLNVGDKFRFPESQEILTKISINMGKETKFGWISPNGNILVDSTNPEVECVDVK